MITADIQQLELAGWIELFDLDFRPITGGGAGDILHFHGYPRAGTIIWGGVAYEPWPLKADGFKIDPSQPAQPTLALGNVNGRITALCLAFQDLVSAKLTRHQTTVRYLDAVNFPDGNPTADPEQEASADVWYVERRASETKEQVVFELASPIDVGDRQLPSRNIVVNVCSWLEKGGYRGPNCGYNGPPVAQIDDSPTDDPVLDVCGGRLTSCWLRFGRNNPISYGGYPAAKLIK